MVWLQTARAGAVLVAAACFLHVAISASAASPAANSDENRPYEFGFNIEGEQHRREKKDENGLIMGEFGFITADGVYHVTVYATDENGNFKILSMKNIRVKPYPTATAPKSRSLDVSPASIRPVQPPTRLSSIAPLPPTPEPSPARACSGCSLPASITTRPKQLTDLAIVSRDGQQFPQYPNQPSNARARQFVPEQNQQLDPNGQTIPQSYDQNQPSFFPSSEPGQFGVDSLPNTGQQPRQSNQQLGQPGQQTHQFSGQPGPLNQLPGQLNQQSEYYSRAGIPKDNGYSLNDPNQESNVTPDKPRLISAQMSIVDSQTDIYKRGPGEREGLPDGLDKADMLQLLYTFNYTVGFHGHHEEGYANGVKKGYYYVTGRDGLRTRVDYVADADGFHPKITNEVLDLLSDDVPKAETEKDEKFGLKGYEFKWIYFPLNSRN